MRLQPMPLGDWAPDQAATGGGAKLTIAKNVIPYRSHYGPLRALAEIGAAIDARPLGAVAARDSAGAVHVYVGDAAKLYEQTSATGAWVDVSRVGGYTASEATRWRFWAFGDRMLATNGQNPIQYKLMSGASDFADQPGSPPLAQHGCAFGQFVMLGNLESEASGVRWCSIGDSEAWVNGVNQAGEEGFPDGGPVQGFAVLDAIYIFQESCIRRAVYVGPPTIFAFDVI